MRTLALIALIAAGCGAGDENEEPAGGAGTRLPEGRSGNPGGTASPSGPVAGAADQSNTWEDRESDTVTASGLRYRTLQEGKGARPAAGDLVRVHYTGTFLNGREFDSSRRRGDPFAFVLGQGMVIQGWDEMVALMQRGSRVKARVPWPLAYGERGTQGIPPRSDLVFDIEMLGFEDLPKYRPLDPAKTETTPSGLKIEPLAAGEGEEPGADDVVRIRYFVWNDKGTLFLTSDAGAPPLRGRCGGLQLTRLGEKFLEEAARRLKPGGSLRCEVPPELCWGGRALDPRRMPGNTTTHWYLELLGVVKPQPMPEFRLPPDEEMTKTASGLMYTVLAEGTGKRPGPTDTVSVYYTGWLTDGTEFDSAHRRGEPTSFPLNRVIAGWTEGLQLMREGGTTLFKIPSDLAYGPRGKGSIPGGATLVFLVELLSVGE